MLALGLIVNLDVGTFIHVTGSVDYVSPEEQFGAQVRAAREAKGLSQEALATELANAGINVGGQSGMARIEKGARPTRLNEVVAIAQFLQIDISAINADVIELATDEEVEAAIEELVDLETKLASLRTATEHLDQVREILEGQQSLHQRRRKAIRAAVARAYVRDPRGPEIINGFDEYIWQRVAEAMAELSKSAEVHDGEH